MNAWLTRIGSSIVAGVVLSAAALGQTVITVPDNKYTPAQDVELGQKAALEVEQQLPILHETAVTALVTSIGHRLVDAIPPELRHPEFSYSFQVVNVREINAFALPGGPMFVNRGMIEAAATEGEVAGVMAHELSHVALRHGTAQAGQAAKYEVGALLGAVVGAIIGGRVGNVVSQGTQFGLGTAFLRFGREYERQADLLGSHIMAQAGYDPREMANMFKTIEKQGGQGGPEWLSDHPDPGNRYEAITREAQLLVVHNPVHDTRAFAQAQTRLRAMAPAPTSEEAKRSSPVPTGSVPASGGGPSDSVAPPSSTYTAYKSDLFRVSVPSNWRELPGNSAVTFAPDGAFGNANAPGSFTHGMEIGVAGSQAADLRTATDEFLSALVGSNPNLTRPSSYDRTAIGGRQALHTVVSNGSNAAGQQERIAVFTMLLDDGTLFYALGVAPFDRFSGYEETFRRVVGSIEIMR